MTATRPRPATDVAVGAPAAEDGGPARWRMVAALGRREGIRLARGTVVPLLLVVVAMNMGGGPGGELPDLRYISTGSAFTFLPVAAIVLVLSHRAVTRPRRDGTEELLTATPSPARVLTAGHLLAVIAPTTLAGVATALMAWTQAAQDSVGGLILTELAVGPLLVAGGGALGVLVARFAPQAFAPYLTCVAIAAVELGLSGPRFAGSGARWLAFWVHGELWWAVPRHSTSHLVYLLGLIAMAAVGALVRHGVTRGLATVALASIAVTTAAGAAQMRQPQAEWRRINAMFARPASVQHCSEHDRVRYCTFDRFGDLAGHYQRMVTAVRAAVPPDAWPDRLVVAQRVTALDLQYLGDTARWLPHLPDLPEEGRIRQPDDGQIHPGLEFGWSTIQQTGFGVQVASAAIGLPLVPDPDDGAVCVAAGQARAVVALWAGAQASDAAASGLGRLVDQADAAVAAIGGPTGDPVFPVAEVDVYGGFVVSLHDARLALRLLDHGDAAERIAEHWEFLTAPTTTTGQLVEALGLRRRSGIGGDGPPFVAHEDASVVDLESTCR